MQHQLFDSQTGKTTTLTCDENTLIIETHTGGKSKTTTKSFAGKPEATQQFIKKEWELLKKGAVMKAQHNTPGQPLLHLFTGAGYTGCLSFVATPHGIYVYRPGGSGNEWGKNDELLRITADGSIAEVLTLPGLLPWDICYDPQRDQLLIDLDHYAYQYDFATASFAALTSQLDKPASFVSVAGSTWAYGTHPSYYITHNPYTQRTQQPLDVSIIKGSIPLSAALSPDGQLLALHNQEGEVKLISTTDNSIVNTLQGDFGRAEQLLWTKDGSQLIVQAQYGQAPLHLFDIAAASEVVYDELTIPEYSQEFSDCCMNADNTLFVCLQRTHAYVFDFTSKSFLYSFPVHHCIKRAQIRFVSEKVLGVRTDYGCFSLYQL